MNINSCWYKNRCTNQCTQSCIRYNLMYSLFDLSELPEAQWGYKDLVCTEVDEGSFIQLSQLNMKEFVETGRILYIWSSNCGNGKTSWSIRLMWKYFDAIWHKSAFNYKAVFVNVQKFLYNCKRSISQRVEGFDELCDKIENADLVIWDDICCAQVTQYEHQILFQYIDGRISAGKANIFTGNENKENCRQLLGERLTSRLFSDYIVEFRESDKRRIACDGGVTNIKQDSKG